jgi:hypothetical protein
MGHNCDVDPCRHRAEEEFPSFLILGVAALIVISGYFLFNDVPILGSSGNRRRR